MAIKGLDHWLTTPPDEPEWKNIETIAHKGKTYTVDLGSDADGKAEYVSDEYRNGYTLIYRFQVTGLHEGEPIDVLMVNPRIERDEENYPCLEYDKLLWADNDAEFDDLLSDSYCELLHNEMMEIIKETWD
jgi:hypothetical protein